jgi:ABC-type transporter Mla MlaB component
VLRITVKSGRAEVRFRLEGRLAGPWVRELQKTWQEIAAVSGAEHVVVDLADVTFVDTAGRELLAQFYRGGATFKACGCLMRCLVDEIKHSVRNKHEGKGSGNE